MILDDPVTRWLAFSCTWVSNVICVYLIVQHIRNYTQPGFQRYICRIIFIVPFYCTASWLALVEQDYSIYFETPRDCYEAWVIYNFMSLCMAYVGGPGAVVVKSEGKVIEPSWVLCTCCMKPIPVDGFFLRNCKQGTLQFVIAKPILAVFTLILFALDLYQVGNWSLSDGFFYEAIIYNFCYSLALFWMLLFYVGTEELLKPYKPLIKFFVFKTVIFLTFWQGLVVTFLATRLGWTPEESEALQNWLICVEMFFAAIGMFFAFPHQEYQLGGGASPGFKWEAFKHAVSISDAIEDIMFQFNPNYKSYVLHTDGGPSENVKRKKFRGKKKKRPAFTMIQQELGALGDKITTMSKLKPSDRQRLTPVANGDVDVEEGAEWRSASRRENTITKIKGLVGDKPQALVSWITENERKQAELLDSDSDAGYDDDNQEDNQLDDEVLTSSTDEEGNRGKRRSRRHREAAAGSEMHGGRVATAGSSSDEEGGGRRRRPGYQRPGSGLFQDEDESDEEWERRQRERRQRERERGQQGGAGPSGVGRQDGDEWALFPRSEAALAAEARKAATDDSWAQFEKVGAAPSPAEGGAAPAATSAALAGASGGGEVEPVPLLPAPPGRGHPEVAAAQPDGADAGTPSPQEAVVPQATVVECPDGLQEQQQEQQQQQQQQQQPEPAVHRADDELRHGGHGEVLVLVEQSGHPDKLQQAAPDGGEVAPVGHGAPVGNES